MNRTLIYGATLLVAVLVAGCQTVPPGAERGPHGTMAYDVLVDASPPGARIEANGKDAGTTPVHLKIFGDPDGTFHDFGSPYFLIKASPVTTNQFEQVQYFGTGQWFGPEDHIPKQIVFDMNKPTQPYPPFAPPAYGYPYPPPYYYGTPYYGGPAVRFYIGPPYPYHNHYRHW